MRQAFGRTEHASVGWGLVARFRLGLALIVLIGLFASAPTASAAPSGEAVCFSRVVDGSLYRWTGAGPPSELIAAKDIPPYPDGLDSTAAISSFCWSQDGSALFLIVQRKVARQSLRATVLYVSDADGGVLSPVAIRELYRPPTALSQLRSVSADGRYVVVSADQTPLASYGDWLIDVDRARVVRAVGVGQTARIHVSPDSQRVVIASAATRMSARYPESWRLDILPLRNGALGATRTVGTAWTEYVDWSADSQRFTYLGVDGGIHVVEASTGHDAVVANPTGSVRLIGQGPAWSGDAVVYTVKESAGDLVGTLWSSGRVADPSPSIIAQRVSEFSPCRRRSSVMYTAALPEQKDREALFVTDLQSHAARRLADTVFYPGGFSPSGEMLSADEMEPAPREDGLLDDSASNLWVGRVDTGSLSLVAKDIAAFDWQPAAARTGQTPDAGRASKRAGASWPVVAGATVALLVVIAGWIMLTRAGHPRSRE